MFLSIPEFYCNIYRLTGYTDHDFSLSEEGEVSEEWVLISSSTPCRYNINTKIVNRRPDGMVDSVRRNFFVENNVDIMNGDRVSVNSDFYKVIGVEPIYDMFNEIHHYECVIELIDWDFS